MRQRIPLGWFAADELLNANRLPSRYEKAARTKALREKARLLGQVHASRQKITARTRVVFIYEFPRGGRRDAANWHPTTKALMDGLVDAGLWPDDSNRYVEGPDNRIGPPTGDAWKRVRIWLEVQPVESRPTVPVDTDPIV